MRFNIYQHQQFKRNAKRVHLLRALLRRRRGEKRNGKEGAGHVN